MVILIKKVHLTIYDSLCAISNPNPQLKMQIVCVRVLCHAQCWKSCVLQVCLQTEAEELRSELSSCRKREKMLTHTLDSERERLTQDVQKLLTQLNSTRERNSQLEATHNNQRVSITHSLPMLSFRTSVWLYEHVIIVLFGRRACWQNYRPAEKTSKDFERVCLLPSAS